MNPASPEPFLAWPGTERLHKAARPIVLVWLWFTVVYAGADWLTAQRTSRVRLHLDWEPSLPLVPAFTLVYVSTYVLFLVVPFVLRDLAAVERLARQQFAIIGLAGAGFLLLPADLAYPPPTQLGMWESLFRLADRLNLDHNLAPSLHVALSFACIEAFAPRASRAGAGLLRGWGVLIAASTLLTHQHHVLDVVTGYALAWLVLRWSRRQVTG